MIKKDKRNFITIFLSHRHLEYNAIETFDNITLSHLHSLQNLRLEGNSLHRVPTTLLIGLSASLQAL